MTASSERELREQKQRGDHAARILSDDLVQQALGGMRETLFHNIRTSHHTAKEDREYLYLQLRAVDGFEKEFTDAINGGKKAESRLTELLNKLRN